MANEEQLAILKQGAKVWNKWRENNPSVEIDLIKADLSDIHLSQVNLNQAHLFNANLSGANLTKSSLSKIISHQANFSGADLSGAALREAKLNGSIFDGAILIGTHFVKADLNSASLKKAKLFVANLSDANFHRSIFVDADLSQAILNGANLSEADLGGTKFRATDLKGVNFTGANLIGSDFHNAEVGGTIFVNLDLSMTTGLETVSHTGPSWISTNTFILSKGEISEPFLRGCGLSDADIEYAKLSNPDISNEEINKILYKVYDLRASQALQVSPLFISYSHGDNLFVDMFEKKLNKKGIRFWRDVHDATSGRLEKVIDRAIRLNPTVILVLSERSLKSDWVEHEVRTARQLEKDMERDVLCPVALDDSWKSSRWPKRVMEQIMEYNILDFSEWQDDVKFEGMFRKLIDGLELFYKG